MGKRKWHVVTVGKDVGVFETWLAAAPLVKGVPDAVYQGFPSKAEALEKFDEEFRKGNVRIVIDGTPSKRSQRRAGAGASASAAQSASAPRAQPQREAPPRARSPTPEFEIIYKDEDTFESPPSTPSAYRQSRNQHHSDHEHEHASTVYHSPTEWSPRAHTHTPKGNPLKKAASQPASAFAPSPKYTTSPVSRTASEPSVTYRAHQRVETLFEQQLYLGSKSPRERVASQGLAQAHSPSPSLSNSSRTTSHTNGHANGYHIRVSSSAGGADDFEARVATPKIKQSPHSSLSPSSPFNNTSNRGSGSGSSSGYRVAPPASKPSPRTTRTDTDSESDHEHETVRSASPDSDSFYVPESPPKIVVKTPSWLEQYPKGPKNRKTTSSTSSPSVSAHASPSASASVLSPAASSAGLLSPLVSTDFPLNSAMGRSHTAPSTPRGRHAPASMSHYQAGHSQAGSSQAGPSPSQAGPSTQGRYQSPHYPSLSAATPKKKSAMTQIQMDPRSPMDSHTVVPELSFVQPLSFPRPSPSNRTRNLIDTPPKSSLLLRQL